MTDIKPSGAEPLDLIHRMDAVLAVPEVAALEKALADRLAS